MKNMETNAAQPAAQPELVAPQPETEILPVLRPKVPRHHAQPYFDFVSLILVLLLISAFAGWWVAEADRRLVQQQLDNVQIARVADARSCI